MLYSQLSPDHLTIPAGLMTGSTSNELSPDVIAGQAVYSRNTLKLYDWLVLAFSNRVAWRCPTRELLAMYNQNVTANHLEVGVGTGYFLDQCQFPSREPRLVLMDLNENCLNAAAARVQRYKPESVRANVLEPIPWTSSLFDSIGLNYVLHCLPGPIREKAVVFDHLRLLLNRGGVLFGSTLLSNGVRPNVIARRLMAVYNRKRIFCNRDDSVTDLERSLRDRFDHVKMTVAGCAALFRAEA